MLHIVEGASSLFQHVTRSSSNLIACKSFSVMYFNCRSMLPKFDELVALCSAEHPDIICLVETWLYEDILDSEVSIPNYSIVRLDRCRHGGDVALFIHNSVLYNVILSGPTGLELIVVSLSRNNLKLCLGVFYRPPYSPPVIFELLCTSLFQSVHQFF